MLATELWLRRDVCVFNVRSHVVPGDMARVWLGGVRGPEGSGSDWKWKWPVPGDEAVKELGAEGGDGAADNLLCTFAR